MEKPLKFFATVSTVAGIQSSWSTTSSGLHSKMSIPPEFEGPGGGLSPEDLFAQALANCFVATFKVMCEKSRITFDELTVSSELIVDDDDLSKKPVMKHFSLRAQLVNASHPERAASLAKRAFDSGFILNSVKTTKSFEIALQS